MFKLLKLPHNRESLKLQLIKDRIAVLRQGLKLLAGRSRELRANAVFNFWTYALNISCEIILLM